MEKELRIDVGLGAKWCGNSRELEGLSTRRPRVQGVPRSPWGVDALATSREADLRAAITHPRPTGPRRAMAQMSCRGRSRRRPELEEGAERGAERLPPISAIPGPSGTEVEASRCGFGSPASSGCRVHVHVSSVEGGCCPSEARSEEGLPNHAETCSAHTSPSPRRRSQTGADSQSARRPFVRATTERLWEALARGE